MLRYSDGRPYCEGKHLSRTVGIGQFGYYSCLKEIWEFQWEISPGVLHLICSGCGASGSSGGLRRYRSGVIRASGVIIVRGPRGKQSGSPYTRDWDAP